jgi:hypothetical protein
MWLIDHQMNLLVSEIFGQYFERLPLKKSAKIVNGNALRINWENIVPKDELNFILGNPPFVGHQWRKKEQMEDMITVFGKKSVTKRLDYVAAWYYKASEFMRGKKIKAAFVSTNSICQGEQVPILWQKLFNEFSIIIHFAHRTFKWSSEARGKAAVHVVIIGFANYDVKKKTLYEYDDITSDPHERTVTNINGYLTAGSNVFITSRGKPLHKYPQMFKGSQPTDGGHLILSEEEQKELIENEPKSEKWIKEFIGGAEFLRGRKRYCLWLKDCPPQTLKSMPIIIERIKKVGESRQKSPTASVRAFAQFPSLFTQDRQPSSKYLCIPEVSSENRNYIPIGFLEPSVICSNKLQIIPKATLYTFGILTSKMHNSWLKYVSGRLKSDISYSPAIYHNFPFPAKQNKMNEKKVEKCAQSVLDARSEFPESSLADLYDPLTMPPKLFKAHQALDKAVDQCYRKKAFNDDTERIEFLFELYNDYIKTSS